MLTLILLLFYNTFTYIQLIKAVLLYFYFYVKGDINVQLHLTQVIKPVTGSPSKTIRQVSLLCVFWCYVYTYIWRALLLIRTVLAQDSHTRSILISDQFQKSPHSQESTILSSEAKFISVCWTPTPDLEWSSGLDPARRSAGQDTAGLGMGWSQSLRYDFQYPSNTF